MPDDRRTAWAGLAAVVFDDPALGNPNRHDRAYSVSWPALADWADPEDPT
jgi:hypothetical protein